MLSEKQIKRTKYWGQCSCGNVNKHEILNSIPSTTKNKKKKMSRMEINFCCENKDFTITHTISFCTYTHRLLEVFFHK
jgi:hypothetical protein